MIVFDLGCKNGHVFEAWFKDSRNYQEQKEQGLIKCPVCGSGSVRKMLSPVRISRARQSSPAGDAPLPPEAFKAVVSAVYKNVVENSEDVGIKFASEALKMHYGVNEPRSIRGVATEEEEEMLREEGVEFFKVPVPASSGEEDN